MTLCKTSSYTQAVKYIYLGATSTHSYFLGKGIRRQIQPFLQNPLQGANQLRP